MCCFVFFRLLVAPTDSDPGVVWLLPLSALPRPACLTCLLHPAPGTGHARTVHTFFFSFVAPRPGPDPEASPARTLTHSLTDGMGRAMWHCTALHCTAPPCSHLQPRYRPVSLALSQRHLASSWNCRKLPRQSVSSSFQSFFSVSFLSSAHSTSFLSFLPSFPSLLVLLAARRR